MKGESTVRTMGRGSVTARLSLLFACVGVLLLLFAAAAAAEETHLFNATLSLTGDCSTSTLDPVPDPGCPGGVHPPKPFNKHGAVTVDLYGNRYVASIGPFLNESYPQGRIDVFDSSGGFITEIAVELGFRASVAVDSQGYLYVGRSVEDLTQRLLRYQPTKYNPAAGEIAYGAPPVAIPKPTHSEGEWFDLHLSLAINPANDHLFVAGGNEVTELSSAAEGNALVEVVLENVRSNGGGQLREYAATLALDSARKRIYVSDFNEPSVNPGVKPVVKVFDLEPPVDPEDERELLFAIDGSTTPTGKFVSETSALPLAVDEATGHVFVGDLEAPTRRVYEFDEDGNVVSTILPEAGFKATGAYLLELAYDDSASSPTEGYLFVPSGSNPGHSLAFEPKSIVAPPEVEELSVSGVAAEEAVLQGKVNPKGQEATYRFEYVTETQFEAQGFEGATLVGEGTLKAANEGIAVSAPLSGLQPGTSYRFRLVAESEVGQGEANASFTTYLAPQIDTNCPNQALRTGPSAALPDCRAYELVTPADTNARPPRRLATRGFDSFIGRQVSPAGDKLPFMIEGGPLPGLDGTGGGFGDPYLSTRTAGGWTTTHIGPSGTETPGGTTGSASPDQGYLFWLAQNGGSAAIEGRPTHYVRYPDGHSELVGQGSLGIDPETTGRLISEGGGHIVFTTGGILPAVQLEPEAPPDGTGAIYDRVPNPATGQRETKVVSLLPGDVPLGAGEHAVYQGASLDGEGVAFEVGDTLYLRYDDEATFEIGEGLDFAGVAEGGSRLFYVQGGDHDAEGDYVGGGDLEAFDATSETTIPFSESGDVTPVQVSADGTAAYFASPSVLTPSVLTAEPNPYGAEPQAGEQNLYLSREGQLSFVATVTDRDVEGELSAGAVPFDGLGLWVDSIGAPESGSLANIPARTTPDGSILLFKSRAALGNYDPAGFAQIYRYDSLAGELHCLSCNPTGVAASADASLQVEEIVDPSQLFDRHAWLQNLSPDGDRAFFQSREALVAADTDGLQDVYQWEGEGVGSCARPKGCLYLISSGESGHDEYLWAVSQSGNDVFFLSSDLLAPAFDPDETPSIYDARVEGGFPPPQAPAGECLGEACQPAAVAPNDPTPASSAFEGAGNVKQTTRPRCPKGKRAVRRGGKSRCVPRHKHRRGAGAKRRAQR
jgi:DNA-binding beta-propeller fold protein YncE